ncbi:MAG: PilC/PilY family type IV pilus protein [Gammaproteobacteria bacterium]
MNRHYPNKAILAKASVMTLAAALTASIGGIGLPAFAATPVVSISNIPLTLVAPAHPQVLLAIPNSQSMDGDLSGAIMTGSGASGIPSQLNNSSSPVDFTVPAGFTPPVTGGAVGSPQPYTSVVGGNQVDNSPSRLNVAKSAIQAILDTFVGNTDFGLLTYSTGAPSLFTTWLYVMSNTGGFTFSATDTSPPPGSEYINNPCYNLVGASTVKTDCTNMVAILGANLLTMPYMLVQFSSDDPTINDVLYAGGLAPVCLVYGTVTPANPYTGYSLTDYNNGGITVSYSKEINGCAEETGPTNAGFVPYQPQTMYLERGFGYYVTTQSATTGDLLLPLQSAGNNPTPAQIQAVINTFTSYLDPETNNTGSSEIKALAVQSPMAGLLTKALAYFNTNPPSSNGCPPQRYVIMITDGLPTEDSSGKSWPPLGSAAAQSSPNGYGVTATFNGDGSLNTTNDQALTDTITELTALQAKGVKTYIVGVGAGVDPALNPTAAATLTAMAMAGNTGNYYAATSPAQVALDMTAILSAIEAANMSTSSAAVNSTGLKAGAVAYQAQFTSADTPWQDWTGNLLAYPILSTGTVNTTTPLWSSQTQLDLESPGSRIIATWNPAVNTGIPFEWCASSCSAGSIDATTALGLDLMTSPTDTTLGPERLTYLRGDHSDEQQNGGSFRNRSHVLGDIVDSNPLYVGPPNGPYQDTSYINFELAQVSRAPMLYVGANDGMLHAIDPATGDEKFAYVPNGVFTNLINLTKPTYNQNHQFFVDGSPTSGDVQFSDSSWHTILAGGLNAGGNSIYALDVTNPSSFTTESALASDVLWEYSDPTGKLGLTYSQPFIARTGIASAYSSTPFVVFFGSGYNNSDGNPYLYAVNAQTGALVTRINLCAAVIPNPCNAGLPNGLSSPVALNSTGALSLPDDTVYAGDLQGNLWKVTISDPNPANWIVQLLFQARDALGNPQPITVAPVVSLHPDFPRDLGTIVYFGTGQLLGTPDLSTSGTQTFYGVWDKPGLSSVITRGNLVQQTLSLPTPGPAGTTVRTVTSLPIDWTTKFGWFEDLSISGERVVSNPRLENGAVVFTTYIPTTSSCAVGGASWLLAVNYQTGGSFPDPELDLNNDGQLNSGDQVDGQNPVGLYLGAVYSAAPTIISASLGDVKAVKLVSESNGQIKAVGQAGGPQQRQSWREIPN